MLIKNCKIIFIDGIREGSVLIKGNKIVEINPKKCEDDTIIDGNGLYLSPGFIDIHIHGAGGYDTMDGSYEAINNISKTIAKFGTTSFLPTTMTCSLEEIKKAVHAIAQAKEKGTEGANVIGAHLEGPFINIEMMGAQNPKYIQKPSSEIFKSIADNNEELISCVTLAPEVEGAEVLIKYLKALNITISLGHSKAKYSEAIRGIECGIGHSTHLYNAMTGLHHREPGVLGAVFDSDITTEIICDGIHVAYPSVRIALKQKGIDKVILVTDAMMACGMKDGYYSLGGQKVVLKDESVRLENGVLAGSILTLDRAVRNLYKNTDYELHEIIKMVTYNAARHCKTEDCKGKVEVGYDADLVIFDEDINIHKVIIQGRSI